MRKIKNIFSMLKSSDPLVNTAGVIIIGIIIPIILTIGLFVYKLIEYLLN
jgi:hypothetical protein